MRFKLVDRTLSNIIDWNATTVISRAVILARLQSLQMRKSHGYFKRFEQSFCKDNKKPHKTAFPRLPVRQWVLSVPKRLRYYMQRDGEVLNIVLRC